MLNEICFTIHSVFCFRLIGFLKDYTKKYDMAFAIGGAMIIIAAFFHIAIICVRPEDDVEIQKDIDEEKIQEKNKLDV